MGLREVVVVDMCISQGVYKIAGLQTGYLRYHEEEECIGGDIEGDSEEDVGTPLV